jgi:hypothetical protein
MKMAVNIVNLIRVRNKAQSHRAFTTFLEETDADGNIPLHSDIRWLSAGKCLQRCFCAKKFLSSNCQSGIRLPKGDTRHGIHIFCCLSCRFYVSFRCPEFQIITKNSRPAKFLQC